MNKWTYHRSARAAITLDVRERIFCFAFSAAGSSVSVEEEKHSALPENGGMGSMRQETGLESVTLWKIMA